MQRRDLLKLAGAGALTNLLPSVVFAADGSDRWRKLLVMIELQGGNDGLNTVIPYADPEYPKLRPNLKVARERVVQLDENTGLHPALAKFGDIWRDKQLAIVQGVGYPEPNQSHFRSIEIWDTASDAKQVIDSGWLARVLADGKPPPSFAADGVVLGRPYTGPLLGPGIRVVQIDSIDNFRNRGAKVDGKIPAHEENPALAHLLAVQRNARAAADRLSADIAKTGNAAKLPEFPKTSLGQQLSQVARLIQIDAGVAAIKVSHGGFDTHVNQLGTHERLLTELAEALATFRAAAQQLGAWDRVMVMTYGEFGRRARENQSAGTDHGTAAPHFVLGGQVKGGLYGAAPSTTDLVNGDFRHTTDFRALYAAVTRSWWGLNDRVVGERFKPLPLLRA